MGWTGSVHHKMQYTDDSYAELGRLLGLVAVEQLVRQPLCILPVPGSNPHRGGHEKTSFSCPRCSAGHWNDLICHAEKSETLGGKSCTDRGSIIVGGPTQESHVPDAPRRI